MNGPTESVTVRTIIFEKRLQRVWPFAVIKRVEPDDPCGGERLAGGGRLRATARAGPLHQRRARDRRPAALRSSSPDLVPAPVSRLRECMRMRPLRYHGRVLASILRPPRLDLWLWSSQRSTHSQYLGRYTGWPGLTRPATAGSAPCAYSGSAHAIGSSRCVSQGSLLSASGEVALGELVVAEPITRDVSAPRGQSNRAGAMPGGPPETGSLAPDFYRVYDDLSDVVRWQLCDGRPAGVADCCSVAPATVWICSVGGSLSVSATCARLRKSSRTLLSSTA